jgi:hypothetical protein
MPFRSRAPQADSPLEPGHINIGGMRMNGDRDERIRARAHAIWEREGRQEGSQDAHWQRAERELAEEEQPEGTDGPTEEPRQTPEEGPAEGTSRRKR